MSGIPRPARSAAVVWTWRNAQTLVRVMSLHARCFGAKFLNAYSLNKQTTCRLFPWNPGLQLQLALRLAKSSQWLDCRRFKCVNGVIDDLKDAVCLCDQCWFRRLSERCDDWRALECSKEASSSWDNGGCLWWVWAPVMANTTLRRQPKGVSRRCRWDLRCWNGDWAGGGKRAFYF